MAYDLTDLRSRLDERALVNNSSLVDNTKRDRAINRALRDISLERDWPWLWVAADLTLTAGTASFNPPTGWRRTASLTHQDTGAPLTRRAVKVIDRVPTTITGRPSIYAVAGSKLWVRAVPDANYVVTHRYIRVEPALVNTSDTPLLPEAFSEGLIHKAAVSILQITREFDRAQEAKVDYKAWLDRVVDDVNQGREPLRVEVRPGSAF